VLNISSVKQLASPSVVLVHHYLNLLLGLFILISFWLAVADHHIQGNGETKIQYKNVQRKTIYETVNRKYISLIP
jgi:hypothetical protein